ncbi:phosphoribosylaminoimidazolesuccinocarboxamide synthase [Lagierella sp.]|uniref:phosphoribosylaminoimidazolesuccinocarboxamide synthase n=1 Tax=Lagierella sp. TaxID=2849657 RepID=UPI002629300F|nr:phosphoribosylaminoimidazolesuccinocarboxamide synthase [Lagierella sp.]
MEQIKKGKTKDFIQSGDRSYFKFKDTLTGTADGSFDTGGNMVAGSKEGAGLESLKVSKYFFEILKDKGIKTHYISSDLEEGTMDIKPAKLFGDGIEVITRFVAVGSFIRRYGKYAKEGQPLNAYTEITLKDDEREDPLITKDGLVELGILTDSQYEEIKDLNIKISTIIKEELKKFDLDLYDIKLEYGMIDGSDEIALVDEVSGGNMRAYKGDQYIDPMELSKYLNLN